MMEYLYFIIFFEAYVKKNNHISFHTADSVLSGGNFPLYSGCLPLLAYLFPLYSGGAKKTRTFQRRMAGRKTHWKLSSLGRQWL